MKISKKKWRKLQKRVEWLEAWAPQIEGLINRQSMMLDLLEKEKRNG